jgi:hypothetical protein
LRTLLCCDTAMIFSRLQCRSRGKGRRRCIPPLGMKKIVVASLALLFFLPEGKASGDEVKDLQWQAVETKHTIIRYKSPEDLKRFNHGIRFSAENHRVLLFSSSRHGKDPAEETGRKVDAVFERVQQILDMRKSMEKVMIDVYHDSSQLHAAFFQIYRQPCRIRAWYRYWNNTIYVNARDLHEGMLAHEMAHAIIDHYMVVRPPRATAEILARYVDQHLEE